MYSFIIYQYFPDAGQEDFNKACSVLKNKEPKSYQVNVHEFDFPDIFKLSLWNIQYDFQKNGTNNKVPLQEDSKWKRNVLEVIVDIFKSFCSHEMVNHNYTVVLRELGLIYQNSVPSPSKTDGGDKWKKIEEVLKKCHKTVKEGDFKSM